MPVRPLTRTTRYVAAAGFAVGLAAFALALTSWRVPGGDGRLAADVTFFASAAGELDVSPRGAFAVRRGLTPRDEGVVGRLSVRNDTGRRVRVRLRAPADRPELDRLLRVEATAGGAVLFRGSLLSLRSWTRRSFELRPDESREVRLRAWLPRSPGARYRGRFATLNVEFRSAPTGVRP